MRFPEKYRDWRLAERRAARVAEELRRVLAARILQQVAGLSAGEGFTLAVEAMMDGRLDPYTAVDRLLGAGGPRGAS